jgi:hypothetical protein
VKTCTYFTIFELEEPDFFVSCMMYSRSASLMNLWVCGVSEVRKNKRKHQIKHKPPLVFEKKVMKDFVLLFEIHSFKKMEYIIVKKNLTVKISPIFFGKN